MNDTIKIFCDGSCSVHDPKLTGAHCAIIDIPGLRNKKIYGAINETTISKMEIKAVTAGIVHVLELAQKNKLPGGIDTVEIYCDSQYVVGCADGSSKIVANRPQWAEFKEAIKLLQNYIPNIIINKIPRNTEPESATADNIAGELRELVADF